MISVQNVTKIYKSDGKTKTDAITNMSLDIMQGEFVFIVGSSGSGKSTFMKMLLKEVEPNYGEIYVDDKPLTQIKRKDIPTFRRNIGVVFQDFRLLPNKNVFENVAFAMEVIEAPVKLIKRNVLATLMMVGLAHKSSVYPHELSGGEQQRVALARAIINKPSILLADEPTGNLDPNTAREIMALLTQINERGTTVIVITHAKDIVDQMKKRVITLSKGVVVNDKKGGYDMYED
ncbi:MAG: cell division ATP-binding protein FtsE [bacterium]